MVKKSSKRVQDITAHRPIQLGHTWVSPKYLRRERVEVGKGAHELAKCGVCLFAERAANFGTKGGLHVGVTSEFDKSPLCETSHDSSE